jgi:hypothetical protein
MWNKFCLKGCAVYGMMGMLILFVGVQQLLLFNNKIRLERELSGRIEIGHCSVRGGGKKKQEVRDS